ncbi:FG-GAP-like repeat-containing protein [Kitasatospora kifunensis]|uniref:Bacterial Ig-like domain-containing protein n=1 Tax=Kitasatospora kifunensis TaxID=58351 RepID=A0A7W7R9H2_KITKI|nr:FG-GAP-like repeat-containing protein [Kitasatospora kifunensis]MBB4927819.1 hypothetical protein [Kitasatospora kifunensis]
MSGFRVPLRGGLAVLLVTVAALAGPTTSVRAASATPAPAPERAVAPAPERAVAAAPAGSLFAPPVAYKAGQYPFEVAVGDFHGTGRVDLAAGNNYDNTVSVFPSNGDGTFAAPQTFPVDPYPGQLLTGDFAGNGRIGLAITAGDFPPSNTGAVDVLLGNGDGTFQPPRSFAVGANPGGLAAGDLRHDGRLDLVTANTGDNTVSVLLGNGDGTFQPQHTYPVGREPNALALADLTGNGRLDLVVTNDLDNTVSVLLGNGDGTFQPQHTYPAGQYPRGVAVGDLTGNGHPDLVVAAANDNAVSVLLGNGDGTFAAPRSYPVGEFPASVAVGDLTRDGHLDVITTGNDAKVSVLLGNGDGTFQPRQAYPGGSFGGRVVVADLTGNGKPDLVVGGDGAVEVLLNISRRPVTTNLSSSVNPSVFGQPVSLTDTVCPVLAAGKAPTGTVTFKDGRNVLGTATLSPGSGPDCGRATLSTAGLSVGPHGLTADYAGDGDHLGGPSAALTQQVTPAQVATSLVSSADPATLGSPVTFTDTVCPALPSTSPSAAPTGTVTFADGDTTIGTGTLAPGGGPNCSRAQASWSHLLPGSHTITARYSGDTDYQVGPVETGSQQIGCARTVTGQAGSVVASGPSTCIVDATVGSVLVEPGAALFVGHSTLGALTGRGAAFLGMCASTVTGTVQVADSSGFVVIGDPAEEGCAGNLIHGSVLLSDNHGGAAIADNRIDGTVDVVGTTGAGPFPSDARPRIEANTVEGSLDCAGNTPPPGNNGRPNTVDGVRTGQCALL